MNPIQVKVIPEDLKNSLSLFIREFKASLSYVSFYSSDSPFVIQAVSKSHRNLQKYLEACGFLLLRVENGKMFLNDADISEIGDLVKIFQDKNLWGVEFHKELTTLELTSWLKQVSLPVNDPNGVETEFPHIHPIPHGARIEFLKSEAAPAPPLSTG